MEMYYQIKCCAILSCSVTAIYERKDMFQMAANKDQREGDNEFMWFIRAIYNEIYDAGLENVTPYLSLSGKL